MTAKIVYKIEEIIGKKFNSLTVINYVGNDKYGAKLFLCECDCSKHTTVRAQALVLNGTKTCGCSKEFVKPLLTHGYSIYSEYQLWARMIRRCYNKNDPVYPRYGGRGITVCDEWKNSFADFIVDMGRRRSDDLSIDRIDNDGNYCFENCKWATDKEQANNRRSNIMISYEDINLNITQWAEKLNINRSLFYYRLYRGGIERIIQEIIAPAMLEE